MLPAEHEGARQGERSRASRVTAWIAVGSTPRTSAARPLAFIGELHGPMHEPAKPGGRHDRWSATPLRLPEPMCERVSTCDVTARQPEGEKRPHNPIDAMRSSHAGRAADAPIDGRWTIVVEAAREECGSGGGDAGDDQLRRGGTRSRRQQWKVEKSRRQSYGTATPHGRWPTLIVVTTRFVDASTTETSFDIPFAVYTYRPSREIATPHGRFPTGTLARTL